MFFFKKKIKANKEVCKQLWDWIVQLQEFEDMHAHVIVLKGCVFALCSGWQSINQGNVITAKKTTTWILFLTLN